MRGASFSFWRFGFVTLLAVALLYTFSVPASVPILGPALGKSGLPGLVGAIVVFFTFWTLLALLYRRSMVIRRESGSIANVQGVITQMSSLDFGGLDQGL